MTPIKKRDLQTCFKKKFGFDEMDGSKHEAVSLFIDEKKIATVRFSRSHRSISDTILSRIAKQCWVNITELRQMYDCTISRDDYLKLLEENGHLTPGND